VPWTALKSEICVQARTCACSACSSGRLLHHLAASITDTTKQFVDCSNSLQKAAAQHTESRADSCLAMVGCSSTSSLQEPGCSARKQALVDNRVQNELYGVALLRGGGEAATNFLPYKQE
jgi:hypothetical protein